MCRGWRPAEFSDGGPRGPFAPTQRRRVARGRSPSAATVRAARGRRSVRAVAFASTTPLSASSVFDTAARRVNIDAVFFDVGSPSSRRRAIAVARPPTFGLMMQSMTQQRSPALSCCARGAPIESGMLTPSTSSPLSSSFFCVLGSPIASCVQTLMKTFSPLPSPSSCARSTWEAVDREDHHHHLAHQDGCVCVCLCVCACVLTSQSNRSATPRSEPRPTICAPPGGVRPGPRLANSPASLRVLIAKPGVGTICVDRHGRTRGSPFVAVGGGVGG